MEVLLDGVSCELLSLRDLRCSVKVELLSVITPPQVTDCEWILSGISNQLLQRKDVIAVLGGVGY